MNSDFYKSKPLNSGFPYDSLSLWFGVFLREKYKPVNHNCSLYHFVWLLMSF